MMSAMDPPLHERVYLGLKADYLSGRFIPGKRIDIQDLANRYHSSKTPVREAAFILLGEGLLTHHPDGGFLVPILKPRELIELLAWHMQLLITALSNVKETSLRRALQQHGIFGGQPLAASLAVRATEIFSSIAEATGNRLASFEVRRLNERLHYSRIIDTTEPALAARELAILTSMDVVNLPKATRRRVEAYHLRKIAYQRKIIQAEIAPK
ncbi:DNA-binding GntR family transcriptional regulator [Sphingomonas sp. BE270]|jgi:DNA-binding GntR family transcriptional regulator|uniref:GntR family transcriptional regulator n=1 Tax=Sphingomonas sp. BE270 TaxID=2817726 RepID=UPI00285DDD31|nr:GntR family transcriptional regulator [Sphingomonas sp. BE270]MDR7256289.1 DNA-binding GntR family transcriptional regulator [Sphingomonas sp. BE270]